MANQIDPLDFYYKRPKYNYRYYESKEVVNKEWLCRLLRYHYNNESIEWMIK